jgi:hypothetical protein
LLKVDSALQEVAATLSDGISRTDESVAKARGRIDDVLAAWKVRRKAGNEELQQVKDQLSDQDIDAESFRALRRLVDDLKTLRPRLGRAERLLQESETVRTTRLAEQERLLGDEVRDLERAAARVSAELRDTVRVTITQTPDHGRVEDLVKGAGGRLKELLEMFRSDSQFSPRDLAQRLRAGEAALKERWSLSQSQLDRLLSLDYTATLELEELRPKVFTHVELNVGTHASQRWQRLEELSKGQKATAILLLLLLDSTAPLVVDQPEDDLDNRFIADRVVPAIRAKKALRQFVFATHNANVPVLADAELIVGLTAVEGADGRLHATVLPEHRGSIDRVEIRHLVEERLEGGRDAFIERKRKYHL